MLKMSCPGLDMWYTPSTSTSARAGAGGAGRSRGACCETARDRKSTRLNSSHDQISYAVFCLKKKKKRIHKPLKTSAVATTKNRPAPIMINKNASLTRVAVRVGFNRFLDRTQRLPTNTHRPSIGNAV